MECDTDTLLALVSSLLPEGSYTDPGSILDALVRCNGDVEATAKFLNSSSSAASQARGLKAPKRKSVSLDAWLTKPAKAVKSSASCFSQFKEQSDSPEMKASKSSLRITVPHTPHQVPTKDLMLVLKPPPSPTKKKLPQLPPLLLTNPDMVSRNTPCTIHLSVLPPELACRLFYTMVAASENWSRNKWWLVDRVVESPHRTAFFARKDCDVMQEAAQHWYNGRMTGVPAGFPPAMEEACEIIERIVNKQLEARTRYPLEWGAGKWRANVAASNSYNGSKESVGFHSDQLTYLGPYPTIASLSLGAQRTFSLREVIPMDEASERKARTYNIPLPHNSLTIMHAPCQEQFKHSIPAQPVIDMYRPAFPETAGADINPSKCRINITFRFYRPDFTPASIPRCKCGIPTILRPDMKNRSDGLTDRYWWACYAGAQNNGKGCDFWKVMDMKAEGRGANFLGSYLVPPTEQSI